MLASTGVWSFEHACVHRRVVLRLSSLEQCALCICSAQATPHLHCGDLKSIDVSVSGARSSCREFGRCPVCEICDHLIVDEMLCRVCSDIVAVLIIVLRH